MPGRRNKPNCSDSKVGISRHCELNRGNRNFGQTRTRAKNRLGILLGHLLKWQYQPELRGNSWLATIREQRREVETSRKTKLETLSWEVIQKLASGLDLAVRNNLPYATFPEICPYTLKAALWFWMEALK